MPHVATDRPRSPSPKSDKVEIEVGDILVWRGDLVHAGPGYNVEHYRIHAYVDPPPAIYRRPRTRDGSLTTDRCNDPE